MARFNLKNPVLRICFAPIVVMLAFAFRMAAVPFTGRGAPYVLFFGAILMCSFSIGSWSGICALLLSAPLATYFFVFQNGFATSEVIYQISLFSIEAIILIVFIDSIQRSKALAERSTEDAKRSAREAERLAKLHDSLLTTVSHDLKTPLTSMLLNSEILIRAAAGKKLEAVQSHAEKIKSSIENIKTFIEGILDFSTIESGNLVLLPQSCAPSAILDEVTELLEPIAHAKSIALQKQISDLPWIECDRVRVMQVLNNLVGNAIKFTHPGEKIILRARQLADEKIIFEIQDAGPGVPQAEQAHIFDRYWQAEKAQRQGHGLGLSIAKGVVEAHHGQIWMENNPTGGSTFSFTLPIRIHAKPILKMNQSS